MLQLGQEQFGFLGFDDEFGGAEGEGEFAVALVGVGGGIEDEGDGAELIVLHPLAAKGEAIHDGHEDVGDDEEGNRLAGFFEGFGAVVGVVDIIAGAFEDGAEEVEVVLLVIDDQDAGLVHGRGSPGMRRSTCSAKVSGSMGFSM